MKRNGPQELYTQFCIGVELGDDTLVRDLVQQGANTMVSYGVDGKITTPIQSAFKKGDVPMILALLSSPATKVRLTDLDSATKLRRIAVTPILVQRVSNALESPDRETLRNREPIFEPKRVMKISLSEAVAEHLRNESLPHASPTDRPRCPPSLDSSSQRSIPSSESVVESDDEDNVDLSSVPSSAGDSSEPESAA